MSELKSLEEVLQDKLLRVGDYQRPYAWEDKQLADLWSDIDLLGDLTHYTGTLVLQNTSTSVRSRSGQKLVEHFVVDGQQRLTTCVILLDRLRRALRTLSQEEALEAATELTKLVEINVEGVQQPRLQLAAELNRFFTDRVLGNEAFEGSSMQAGQVRIEKAAGYFDTQIAQLLLDVPEDDQLERLLRLRTRVCYQLQFIVYNVQRADEVGVLFETVNGRGKNLTELERVKNYLLYLGRQLNDAQRESIANEINHAWSEIFKKLGRVELREDSLLRSHWLVTQDANLRNWRGAESVKAKFPRSDFVDGSSRLANEKRDGLAPEEPQESGDRLYEALKKYVDTLRRSASFLSEVQDPSAEYPSFEPHSRQIMQTTASLRRSGSVASFYPLLIATRLTNPTDAELYQQVIEFCERFSARVWAIRGLRSNAGESSIRWAARDLYTGRSPEEVLAVLNARLWQLAPDDQVLASFDVKVQWYPRSTAHKFVLYEYELAKQRDASDVPHFGDMTAKGNKTTEHILPQTPEEGSAWWSSFTTKEHSELVDGIGNLVLTRDNSRYGRRDYLDSADGSRPGKRGEPGRTDSWCYFNSANLARERELAETYKEWNPATIADRANTIASWALTRWPASAPSESSLEVDDDRLLEDEEEALD